MKYLVLLLSLIALPAFSLTVPTLTSPVMDEAKILSLEEKTQLETLIRNQWETDKLAQISILIIPSLEAEFLENYSIKVAEQWQLGTKESDNGVLILLAMKEKRVRVEVGQGLEGAVTDLESGRLISNLGPYMIQKEYAAGLTEMVQKINQLAINNTPEAKEAQRLAAEKRAKEQEESIENLIQFLSLMLGALFFGGGAYCIYQSIVVVKKEQSLLKLEHDQLYNKALELVDQVEEFKQKSQIPLDHDKERYQMEKDRRQHLRGEKIRIQSTISTMKNFLRGK